MTAQLLKFGEHPPIAGGEYEKVVSQTLRNELSHRFLIITNPSFPTKTSFFYEYDIILLSPFYCEVIEIKSLYSRVDVYEDWLVCVNNLHISGIFSKLETKAKVFSSKLNDEYFWKNPPFVNSRVIVGPPETRINYKEKKHQKNNKLIKLAEAIKIYKEIEKNHGDDKVKIDSFNIVKEKIKRNYENLQTFAKNSNRIGRFHIKRIVEKMPSYTAFWAQDEPPCSVDVYLKEYPFENQMNDDIETFLDKATHGMQVLRSLRHQFISCVIGHFQTGCSLVQINDWFEGTLLSEKWHEIEGLSLSDKISLMIKIAQGIGYCHEKGIFHRNICAESILVNNDFDDLRITGFDYAKNIEKTRTLTTTLMNERNGLLIPPEELLTVGSQVSNLRLYDIYQAGLLYYRICENGFWPFENPFDYCTGEGHIKERSNQTEENGAEELTTLIKSMLSIKPQNRPDLMQKVEDGLRNALELNCM